jgi:hypothetical protein
MPEERPSDDLAIPAAPLHPVTNTLSALLVLQYASEARRPYTFSEEDIEQSAKTSVAPKIITVKIIVPAITQEFCKILFNFIVINSNQ